MNKYIIILFSMLLLAGNLTNAQTIKRSKHKTEQTQKSNNTTKSSTNTSKSSKAENPKSNNSSSTKKNKSQKANTTQSDQSSSSASSSSGSSSSQSTSRGGIPVETSAYDVTFSCNVPGADMYIDGKGYGHPKGTHSLKKGSYQVKLVAEGYEEYITTIQVAAGNTSFNFMMTRDVTAVVQRLMDDMVWVEGGTFTMGATAEQEHDASNDEKPAHKVTLLGYYICKYEVTQELWQAVMGNNPSKFKGGHRSPVEQVSWDDCQQFINKLNALTGKDFRLPTEAEWEYAARGGNHSKGYKYSGGNNISSVAFFIDNSDKMTHTVGYKSPNELGLFDMSGNVNEWCQDGYGSYSKKKQTNPTGSTESLKVYRGGSWDNKPRFCRVSDRYYNASRYTSYNLGLRLAASSLY